MLGILAGVQLGVLIAGQSYNLLTALPYALNAFLVALNYGLIGFALAAATGRRGLALAVASGLAFAGYLVNAMSVSVTALQTADKLTLFHYYSTHGSYNWNHLIVQVLVALALLVVSLVGFTRRDIRAN
jgi:ABC-2 type transport system permease protein